MSPNDLREPLARLTGRISERLAGRPLDAALGDWLNAEAGPASTAYRELKAACQAGVAAGWLCQREAGGIRYGRVFKPADDLHGFSVDVVDMADVAGPHHVHPAGEIDLIMPIEGDALFDGAPAGWRVCPPGSAHRPTVSGGRALVLYLLPGGRIDFTREPGAAPPGPSRDPNRKRRQAMPAASPVAPPPERFNFAAHLLALNAAHPERAAFVDDRGTLRYGALDERVRRCAAALRKAGIRREERVLLMMLDGNDWPVGFLGAMYAGVVPVAINTLLTPDDVAYMLEHSRAQAVLVSGALLPTVSSAMVKADHEVELVVVAQPVAPLRAVPEPGSPLHAPEVDFEAFVQGSAPLAKPAATAADDPGFWLYSSGSTGRPKGTVHSQANPYWTSELYGRHLLGLRADDVCFSAAKLFFAYGLGNALTFPLTVGATTLLMAERPTPEAVFKRWRGEVGGVKPTIFFGAPTGYAGMLAHPALPRRSEIALRMASSAGEALPAELGQRFKAQFGVDIVDGIGSTEMLHIFLSNRPDRVRYGTTGWPVPGYRIELRGDDGGPVPDGEPGDLYIHGPSSALMYWGNRAKSRETFQGGWTKSGDKYVKNADGSYTYGGRSDDMLKVSGIYVSPFEVEATLVQHPAVLEAAVIGVPDAEGLTKTKAFVVLKPGAGATDEELKAFVKDKLAPYKYPRQIEFMAELPKTATGKIQRFRLRERETGR